MEFPNCFSLAVCPFSFHAFPADSQQLAN